MFRQITVLNGGNSSVNTEETKEYVLNNDIRSSKGRSTSGRSWISSMGNQLAGMDQGQSLKAEKLGIRKLAKAYTKTLVGSWSNGQAPQYGIKVADDRDLTKEVGSLRIEGNCDYSLTLKSSPKIGVDYSSAVSQYKGVDDNESYNNNGTIKTLKREKRPLGVNKNVSNISIRKSSHSIKQDIEQTRIEEENDKRELILSGFPNNVGVSSILSYISGGPLEKLYIESSRSGDDIAIKKLIISFIRPDDAKRFFQFTKTGLFVICNQHIDAQWLRNQTKGTLNDSFNAQYSLQHSLLTDTLRKEVENGACRCLIIKKVLGKRQKQNSRPSSSSYTRQYTVGKPHCSDFAIKEIEDDFSQFGKIIEITPAISRKLCVSIHFENIRSAILAKEAKENQSSSFHNKYSDWAIWYGKDPTDHPCIQL